MSHLQADKILGVSTSQRVLNKINTNKLRKAVIAYDKAVGSYVEEFGSDRPPQKTQSVEAVLERRPDDLFWSKSCSIREMSHGPRTSTVRKVR